MKDYIDKYLKTLKTTQIFQGLEVEEIRNMLGCLNATVTNYDKNEYIYRNGETVKNIGIVLWGNALIIKEDFWGNRSIISEASAGSIFAETYACNQLPLEVSVVASNNCEILFLDFSRILHVCSSACSYHTHLIQNLMSDLANKNRMLTKKMEHMSKKTTRDKLLSYLSAQYMQTGTSTFQIPYNRQELADYLSLERSAMCATLGKLQKEGLISYHKNTFTLHDPEFQ